MKTAKLRSNSTILMLALLYPNFVNVTDASDSNQNFDAAIADYTRAIELNPADTQSPTTIGAMPNEPKVIRMVPS